MSFRYGMNLLLPGTDTTVLIEALVVVVAFALALVFTWQRGEWRTLTAGAGVFVLALLALRAMH